MSLPNVITCVGGVVAVLLMLDGVYQHFATRDPFNEAPRKIATAAGLALLVLIALAVTDPGAAQLLPRPQ